MTQPTQRAPEQCRTWTPQTAARRLGRLIDLGAYGISPPQMREMSELGLLLHAPVAGHA